MATPLLPDGSVDIGGVRRLVDYVVAGGVVGVFAASSTGEGPLLADADRAALFHTCVEASAGRAAVLANVSDTSTARVLAWVRAAADAGADAVVATLPYYLRHDGPQVCDFYLRLADEAPVPLLVYNVPVYAKVQMPVAALAELACHANIVGVKDSTLDWRHFQQVIRIKQDHPSFTVLNGDEQALASTVFMGGDGGVLGLANLAPRLCADLLGAAERGDIPSARELQARLTALQAIWSVCECGHGGLKLALELLGICGRHVTAPLRPAPDEAVPAVRALLHDAGAL
jgi:dihydrodipicolinate synthase/N-acetylneuraminate lyase